MQLFKAIQRFKTKKKIKSVIIELSVRENKLDAISEALFAAREVVKLGFAKDAVAMPWGIQVVGVPANRLDDLKHHAKSMGANRWWVTYYE